MRKTEYGILYGTGAIKNIHIKHWAINKKMDSSFYKKADYWRYLCQQCVTPTPEKVAKTVQEVTCKNCLRELEDF